MDNCGKCGAANANQVSYAGIICKPCAEALLKVCDICNGQAAWRYPVKRFVWNDIAGSAEDWIACDPCHDLIEARDYVGLSERGMALFLSKHEVSEDEMPVLRSIMADLHNQFRANRQGDPVRIDN